MNKYRDFIATYWIPAVAVVGIILYFAFLGQTSIPLIIVILVGGIPLLWETMREVFAGKFNVDLIAIVSIFGGLFVGEYLPAAVIVLMLSGGNALEAYAVRRASSALQALMKRSPRTANRWDGKNYLEVAVTEVKIGDRLLVRPGESVPVDGEITDGSSELDESLLTGESLPVERSVGQQVISGSINTNSPLTIVATTSVKESTFTKIMELVEKAHNNRADIQQTADQFGVWFTPITFIMVALTYLLTHDLIRAYAVLVIATPCPLILATPVAIIAGIGKAAKEGIIIKSGLALEAMSRAKAILFDKTGTLTTGNLKLKKVVIFDSTYDEGKVLSLAAALEQYSNHVIARSVTQEAKKRRLPIPDASEVKELPAKGLSGKVGKQVLYIGNQKLMTEQSIPLKKSELVKPGEIRLFIATPKKLVAELTLSDQVRPESKKVIELLEQHGFDFIAMITGDRQAVADSVGKTLGISQIFGEVTPQGKLETVEKVVLKQRVIHHTTIMVGDGINDAPALERADVGIAIGRQGGEVSVEAADVVLLGEKLDRLPEGIRIGKGVMRIVGQGIWFGMITSLIGMIAASLGYLPPIAGALLQEVIDVLAILNALRVLRI